MRSRDGDWGHAVGHLMTRIGSAFILAFVLMHALGGVADWLDRPGLAFEYWRCFALAMLLALVYPSRRCKRVYRDCE